MAEADKPKLTRSEIARLGALALHKQGKAGRFNSETAQTASLKAKSEGKNGRQFTSETGKEAATKLQQSTLKDMGPETYSTKMRVLGSSGGKATMAKLSPEERHDLALEGAYTLLHLYGDAHLRKIGRLGGKTTTKKYRGTDFYKINGQKSARIKKQKHSST